MFDFVGDFLVSNCRQVVGKKGQKKNMPSTVLNYQEKNDFFCDSKIMNNCRLEISLNIYILPFFRHIINLLIQ